MTDRRKARWPERPNHVNCEPNPIPVMRVEVGLSGLVDAKVVFIEGKTPRGAKDERLQ